ncbi:hypothetical protein ACLKA6_019313 [Drosophila palustris]
MVFSDEEEEPVVPEKVTETVVEKEIVKSVKPEIVTESSIAEDTSTTVTVTTTTVTETVSESALPEQPKAVVLEKKPEEPKKPAYAGLPVDESSSSWMDVLDEPMVFSDEEEETVVPEKVAETVVEKEIVKSVEPEIITESSIAEDTTTTVTVTTTTVTETVGESALPEQTKSVEPKKKPEEPKKPAYAGLPVDDSSSSWMDVLDEPMVFSDEEEEPVVPEKVTETVVEKEIVKSVKPEIVTESSIAEDITTTVTVTTTTVTETVSESALPEQPKAVVLEKKPEEPKKPAYAGLPVDESSSSWMDVLDEPMVFSDEEEETVVPLKVAETVVEKEIVKSVEPEIITESSIAEDTTTTVTVTTTTVTETVSESALREQPTTVELENKIAESVKELKSEVPADVPTKPIVDMSKTSTTVTTTTTVTESINTPVKEQEPPAFVLESDQPVEHSVWENNRDGKSYADVLLNSGLINEVQVVETPVVETQKPVPVVETLDDAKKPKEQKTKRKQQQQKPVKHIDEDSSTEKSKHTTESSKEPSSDEKDVSKAPEISWSALVRRPGEWSDTTIPKKEIVQLPSKVKENKPKKEEKEERKSTKTKKAKKSKKQIEEPSSTTSEDEKQDVKPEANKETKSTQPTEPITKPEEEKQPESTGFSWASLVKRPGEWVDTTVTHIKTAITSSTDKVETESKESEKPKKTRQQKKTERFEAKKQQTTEKEEFVTEPTIKPKTPVEIKKPGDWVDDIESRKKPIAAPRSEPKPEPKARKERKGAQKRSST